MNEVSNNDMYHLHLLMYVTSLQLDDALLHKAVEIGCTQVVELLLSKGANANGVCEVSTY